MASSPSPPGSSIPTSRVRNRANPKGIPQQSPDAGLGQADSSWWVRIPKGFRNKAPGLRAASYPATLGNIPSASQLRRSCAIDRNNAMPQSLSAVYLHLVFSTKERRPFLRDKDLRESLHA